MERLPPTSFGRELRSLIRETWKTQKRFAEAIGVDETWVAKVIRGDQESLTYASFTRMLVGFPLLAEQERLYLAWVSTFAPSPAETNVPTGGSLDEELIRFARSVHDRISAGRLNSTHKLLSQVWDDLQKSGRTAEVRLALGEALVQTAQHLDRIDLARRLSIELFEIARSENDPGWMARTLWLGGVTARLQRPRNLGEADQSLADLASYLESWRPKGADSLRLREELRRTQRRDHVLSAGDIARGLGSTHLLSKRVASLESRTSEVSEPAEQALTAEVLARSHIVLGQLDSAENWLKRSDIAVAGNAGTHKVKRLICAVQLSLAMSRIEQAEELLWSAADTIERFGFVHHRVKLATLEHQVRAAAPGRKVFT